MNKMIVGFSIVALCIYLLFELSRENSNTQNIEVTPVVEEFQRVQVSKDVELKIKSNKNSVFCNSYLNNKEPDLRWAIRSRLFIVNYSKQISSNLSDPFGVYSGIGVYRNRSLLGFNDNYYGSPPFDDVNYEAQSHQVEVKLKEILQTGTIEKLLDFVDNLLDKHKYFINQGQPKHLLGFIAQYKYGNDLVAIMDLEIPIFNSDIVDLIKADIHNEILIKVIEYSSIPLSLDLKNAYSFTSLANIALKYEKFIFAAYLINQGSPTSPDLYGENSLDLLTKHRNKLNMNQFIMLFELINDQVDHPYSEQLTNKLNLHLKKIGFTKQESFLTFTKKEIPDAETIQKLTTELHLHLLTGFTLHKAESLPENCIKTLGKLFIDFALELGREDIQHSNTLEVEQSPDNQEFNDELSSFGTSEQAIQYLSEKKTLSSKNKILSVKTKLLQDKLLEYREQLTDNKFTDIIKQVYKLVEQNRWEEAITLLESVNESKLDIYTSLLHIAIFTNADRYIINRLIDKGGVLLPSTVHTLIQTDNSNLANYLLPKGLDINYVDLLGSTTIANAVKLKSLRMLKFLLENDAKQSLYSPFYNALDFALLQYSDGELMFEYIELLLVHGYVIELSHKQIVMKLIQSKPHSYYLLTKRFPIFKIRMEINNEE